MHHQPQPKKVRGDAKLERLTAQQHEQMLVWLDDENRTYIEVAGLVRTGFGLSVGKSAVADYWRRHVMPQRSRQQADTAAEIAALPDDQFVAAMLKLAKLHAWEAISQPTPDVRQAAAMMSLVHNVHRTDIARQRLALAERRVALAEKSTVTPRPAQDEPFTPADALRQPQSITPPAEAPLSAPSPRNLPLYPASAEIVGEDLPEDSLSSQLSASAGPISSTGPEEQVPAPGVEASLPEPWRTWQHQHATQAAIAPLIHPPRPEHVLTLLPISPPYPASTALIPHVPAVKLRQAA